MVKNTFLELLTPFFSKTRANFLLLSPDLDSTGKNLSKSVIIEKVPKSLSDYWIDWLTKSGRNGHI